MRAPAGRVAHEGEQVLFLQPWYLLLSVQMGQMQSRVIRLTTKMLCTHLPLPVCCLPLQEAEKP